MKYKYVYLKYMFCKYKDIFGKPRQGAHSIRVFDFAIIDILLTFVGAYIIKIIGNKYDKNLDYSYISLLLFIIAIFLHWLFCVNTKLNVLLFGKI